MHQTGECCRERPKFRAQKESALCWPRERFGFALGLQALNGAGEALCGCLWCKQHALHGKDALDKRRGRDRPGVPGNCTKACAAGIRMKRSS